MDRLKSVDPRVYIAIGVVAFFTMAFLLGYGEYLAAFAVLPVIFVAMKLHDMSEEAV